MNYYFSKTVQQDFERVIETVIQGLNEEGFEVLVDIDVRKILKKKLDVDFPPYRILGTCNAPYMYIGLEFEGKIGTLLPCNIIVRETKEGLIEVSAINPLVSMKFDEGGTLEEIAYVLSNKLEKVFKQL